VTPLRVGIVGAGRAGGVHAENLHQHTADGTVAAIIDADLDRARALGEANGGAPAFETLEQALEDGGLDAVVVATPTFTHRDLVVGAAGAGLHVFCEKPMGLSLADCDAMIDAADSAGTVLQIGFVRRFQPEFLAAAETIAGGEIGSPMIVKSLTRGPGLPPRWAQDASQSNGMLAEVNSHDFDSVAWLAGSPIVRVYSEVSNRKGEALGVEDEGFYDNAVVALRFENEAVGTIDGSCPAEYGYDARMEVVGTKGMIAIGETHGMPVMTAVDRSAGGRRPVHRTWPERFPWAYVGELKAFVASALRGEPVRAAGGEGRAAVAAVLAANRSWREGRPVELAEVMA